MNRIVTERTQRELIKTGLTQQISINSAICGKHLKTDLPKSKNGSVMSQSAGKNYVKGYILGVYYGGGSIARNPKGKPKSIRLTTVDLEFAEKFKGCLETFFNGDGKIHPTHCPNGRPAFVVELHSVVHSAWLAEYQKDILPALQSPDERRGFLDGMLDSKGYVCRGKANRHHTTGIFEAGVNGQNKWIHELEPWFLEFGVKTKFRLQHMVRPHGEFDYYGLRINLLSFIQSPLRFCIERKLEKLREYIDMVRSSTTVRRKSLGYDGIKIQSGLHGDMQRSAEMTDPFIDEKLNET